LPKDSFHSAEVIRKALMKKFKIKKLGVLITDSRLMLCAPVWLAWLWVIAGFKGVRNYIGKKDIFGRTLEMSRTDIADSLATAAVVVWAEGKRTATFGNNRKCSGKNL